MNTQFSVNIKDFGFQFLKLLLINSTRGQNKVKLYNASKMKKNLLLLSLICISAVSISARNDLFDLLDEDSIVTTLDVNRVVYATFKGTQLINAATNETPGKGFFNML